MDFLNEHESIAFWLNHYGSFALFGLLALGIIALPVPEETLLVLTGVLISKGRVNIPATLIAALAGSMTGITTSYIMGRTAGKYALIHYGGWLGATEEKLAKAHEWFEKWGPWLLFFGYFVPGVRHFTGVVAGMTYLEYPKFALFAYMGAFFWVALFVSIGYFFGDYWAALFEYVEREGEEFIILAILLVALYLIAKFLYKKY